MSSTENKINFATLDKETLKSLCNPIANQDPESRRKAVTESVVRNLKNQGYQVESDNPTSINGVYVSWTVHEVWSTHYYYSKKPMKIRAKIGYSHCQFPEAKTGINIEKVANAIILEYSKNAQRAKAEKQHKSNREQSQALLTHFCEKTGLGSTYDDGSYSPYCNLYESGFKVEETPSYPDKLKVKFETYLTYDQTIKLAQTLLDLGLIKKN